MTSHPHTSESGVGFGRRAALRALLVPAGAAVLTGCAGTLAKTVAKDPVPQGLGKTVFNPDGTRRFRNHRLRDQEGREVLFYDDLVKGRIFAATFGYASCKGVCTQISGSMGAASELIAPMMGNPVRFYTFSLAEDSPADMKKAMQARGLYGRPGWYYITGSADAVRDIRWAFGFGEPNEQADSSLAFHTGMARFGYHSLDKWGSCPALGSPTSIASSMLAVFPPSERIALPELQSGGGSGARPIPGFKDIQPLVAMR